MWADFRVAGWVLVVSLLLVACQALDYEGQAPAYRIPTGTVLELHRDLIVPPGQAGVNIQGTAIGDRYRYDAVCRLEVLTVDDSPRPVRTDHFTVERVGREWEIFSNRASGLRYVALFERDGPHLLLFTTFLYLRSERQPDVFRLACGHLQNSDQNPRHLTVAEIRATLAPVMTLQ
jgi:hypothetical protein